MDLELNCSEKKRKGTNRVRSVEERPAAIEQPAAKVQPAAKKRPGGFRIWKAFQLLRYAIEMGWQQASLPSSWAAREAGRRGLAREEATILTL